MKASKVKEVLRVAAVTAVAVAVFGGALLGINTFVLQAATNGETYLPQAVAEVSIPDDPVEAVAEGPKAPNLTVINTTFPQDVVIPPLALPMEDAAQIGAQYIMDVLGVCIDGMYVELTYIRGHEGISRTLWNGAVSSACRDTITRMLHWNEVNDELMARMESGVDRENADVDVLDTLIDELNRYEYISAYFYFTIDAVTGQRIDIWQTSPGSRNATAREIEAINEYLRRERGGYGRGCAPEISAEDKYELGQLAAEYAQRHFNNSAVVDVEFAHAFTNLVYAGNNNIARYIYAMFAVTDDTGRVAHVSICLNDRVLNSISTIRNDLIHRYGTTYREEVVENITEERRIVRESELQ